MSSHSIPHHSLYVTNEKNENFFVQVVLPHTMKTIEAAANAAVPVLFCVHGAGMSSDNFLRLALHLSHNQEQSVDEAIGPAPRIADYSSQFAKLTPPPEAAGHARPPCASGPPPGLPRPPPHPTWRPTATENVVSDPHLTPGTLEGVVEAGSLPPTGVEEGKKVGEVQVATVAFDLRCHGQSTFNGGEAGLSLSVLVEDFLAVLSYVGKTLFPSSLIFILGHSLGAAIVASGCAAPLPPPLKSSVCGVVLLDAVEGTAKMSIGHMREFLQHRPTTFASVSEAEHWFLRSGGMRTPEGAAISVPPLLRAAGDNKTLVWRSDLLAMEAVWDGWFDGLDANFLNIPLPKMLCVASVDRLDQALTVGHMQGKFQLEVCGNNAGHYIQDDAPCALSAKLRRFVKRTQDVKKLIKGGIFIAPLS